MAVIMMTMMATDIIIFKIDHHHHHDQLLSSILQSLLVVGIASVLSKTAYAGRTACGTCSMPPTVTASQRPAVLRRMEMTKPLMYRA